MHGGGGFLTGQPEGQRVSVKFGLGDGPVSWHDTTVEAKVDGNQEDRVADAQEVVDEYACCVDGCERKYDCLLS